MKYSFWSETFLKSRVVGLFAIGALLFAPMQVDSQAMSSANYQIAVDTISYGGEDQASSDNYKLGSTLGEFFAFTATSANYESKGGFWQAVGGEVALSLDTAAINLGSLEVGSVGQGTQTVTVTSTFTNGYALTIRETGELQNAALNTIEDVTDGEVTINSEEYGFTTDGTDGQFNDTDTSITGVAKTLATRAALASSVTTTITYKAAASLGTESGDYSHNVILSVTSGF